MGPWNRSKNRQQRTSDAHTHKRTHTHGIKINYFCMKIGAGPCTSYIFIIKTETAPKSPVGGGGYGDLSPNRRQKNKGYTKYGIRKSKENTNERQLFDAIRWRERKTFSSIRSEAERISLWSRSPRTLRTPRISRLCRACRLLFGAFPAPLGSPSAFRIFGVSSSGTTLHLKERLRTLRQSVENQPTCALHYEPENRRCTTQVSHTPTHTHTHARGKVGSVEYYRKSDNRIRARS